MWTGSEHCGEIQHVCCSDGDHQGWRRPVPSLPALYTCLSRCSCLHEPHLHHQHHTQTAGTHAHRHTVNTQVCTAVGVFWSFQVKLVQKKVNIVLRVINVVNVCFCSLFVFSKNNYVSGCGSAVFSWSNQSRGWRQRDQHSSDLFHPVRSVVTQPVMWHTPHTNCVVSKTT